MPDYLSFSDIKIDQLVELEMDDIHIAKIQPKFEINIVFCSLKDVF